MITAQQRALYDEVWTASPAYRDHSPGEHHLAMFLDMARPSPGQRVLDAGCGSGKGAVVLHRSGFRVALLDITDAGLMAEARPIGPFHHGCLWDDLTPLGRFDWAYCCDVLEHIPTEYTMLTIARLLAVASRGVYLSIALVPDQFGVWVGEPLHRTVQPFTWWRDRLRDLGTLIECRDCLLYGAYLVRAK